ncbi:MAG: hypothetical protein AAGD01_16945 [Acidobacteriota bacterium]
MAQDPYSAPDPYNDPGELSRREPYRGSFETEELVDDFIGEDMDWRRVVTRNPKISLLVAALGGYILARNRGHELLRSFGDYAAQRVGDSVNDLLGDRVI